MGTIFVKTVNPLDDTRYEFTVAGYGVVEPGTDFWYLNSNGYAQKFDAAQPPFSGDSRGGVRLLLVPVQEM